MTLSKNKLETFVSIQGSSGEEHKDTYTHTHNSNEHLCMNYIYNEGIV